MLSINGVDITAYVREVQISSGFELTPWQLEFLELMLGERSEVAWVPAGRRNGRRRGAELVDLVLDGAYPPPAPFTIEDWMARREAGRPPCRVEVDGGRVELARRYRAARRSG